MIKCIILLGLFSLQVSSSQQNGTSYNSSCFAYKSYIKSSRKTLSGSNSCLGKTYHFGHQFQKFWKECFVEPENPSLSFTECHWKVYNCVVKKSLGSRPLTLSNYAEMMSRNLSETVKSAIFSNLNEAKDRKDSKNEGVTDGSFVSNSIVDSDLETKYIKKYWKLYFDAEFEVCTDSSNNTCGKAIAYKELQVFWNPAKKCQGGEIPKFQYHDNSFTEMNENISECYKRFNDSYAVPEWDYELASSAYTWCTQIAKGKLSQDGGKINKIIMDYEPFYYAHVSPSFYSKSVKDHVYTVFQNEFYAKYYNENDTSPIIGGSRIVNGTKITTLPCGSEKNCVKAILNHAVQTVDLHLTEEDYQYQPESRMVLINANILKALLEVNYRVHMDLCYGSQLKPRSNPNYKRIPSYFFS